MKRDLTLLPQKEYDLIVVGGGIFGVCAAWDAALRGLSVALLEKEDFGHATSANHFKVIHGGIRYLQHGDIYRVRESSKERTAFLRIAPHLVYPMPFVIPTYGHGMTGKEAMGAALLLYDLLTFDRNRGLNDPHSHVPPGRLLSRAETLHMFPSLNQKRLTGAAIFHDGQIYNPPRLSLAFVRSAADAGAQVANYVEVTGFLREGQTINGVRVQDRLLGEEFELRGKVILNASGPWANGLLKHDLGIEIDPPPSFSRDAYFIVNRRLIGDHGLAVQGQTHDPDALLSRGNRHIFLVPWRENTLVGVWHKVYDGKPEGFTVTEQELKAFIDEINTAYPSLDLTINDVSQWNAGLTLFGENSEDAKHLSYGKRSLVFDHSQMHNIDGIITLIGVRFTTARGIAQQVVDLIFGKLGRQSPPCRTTTTTLYGGEINSFEALLQEIAAQVRHELPTEAIEALAHNYGAAYQEVTSYFNEDPTLMKTVGTSTVLEAEVIHAVRSEMALRLADVVFRRTDLATAGYPGEEALQLCAELMAAELGWEDHDKEAELAEVRSYFPQFSVDKEIHNIPEMQ